MSRAHEQAVLEALGGTTDYPALELTFLDLQAATGMPADLLDDALWKLTGRGCVKQLPGGRYRAISDRHSRAVKRGLFVKSIPSLGAVACAYVAAGHPVVGRLQGLALWAL